MILSTKDRERTPCQEEETFNNRRFVMSRFDVDVEHLLDGVLVVVEGLQGQFLTGLVERRALPTLVDLFERNAPGAVDGIDQPDITVEKRGGIAFRRTARFSTL